MTYKKPDTTGKKDGCPGPDNSADLLQYKIDETRARWRDVRQERLRRKSKLIAGGVESPKVKKDFELKRLRKEQRRLSRRLIHLERKLNRLRARE